MISKEMKLTVDALEKLLAEKYEPVQIADKNCFKLAGGKYIAISAITAYNAVVVEYADSYEDAKLFRFEDGDMFPLDGAELSDLFQAICREIEQ